MADRRQPAAGSQNLRGFMSKEDSIEVTGTEFSKKFPADCLAFNSNTSASSSPIWPDACAATASAWWLATRSRLSFPPTI